MGPGHTTQDARLKKNVKGKEVRLGKQVNGRKCEWEKWRMGQTNPCSEKNLLNFLLKPLQLLKPS